MNILINQNSLKHLDNINTNTIFIMNRYNKNSDKKIFKKVFGELLPNINILPIDDKNPELLVKIIKNQLENHKNKTQVFACSLAFSAPKWGDILHQKQLNSFFKAIKEQKLQVVLIFADSFIASNGVKNEKHSPIDLLFQNQKDIDVKIRISPPINNEELEAFDKSYQVRRFLQSRLFALNTANINNIPNFFNRWLPYLTKNEQEEPIAVESDYALIVNEIEKLQLIPNAMICEQGGFEVFISPSNIIPNILKEIGRLREMTFRSVGEGTGKTLDIDEFDLYYHQLIIWDNVAQKIVGGYRIGLGKEIFNQYGVHGFYTSTLFKIEKELHVVLGKSIELGRSFIIEAYQRKPQPLFLLWKGIHGFILQNPDYEYLFGPVSISKKYSNVSKSLMVSFLKKYYFDDELGKYLKPRKPFKIKAKKVDSELLIKTLGKELNTFDKFIELTEDGQFRLPVLVRQYLRQNAKFIGFNIDPKFSNCLDGFIIAKIKNLPESTLSALQKERASA
jgi:putative hemolysin